MYVEFWLVSVVSKNCIFHKRFRAHRKSSCFVFFEFSQKHSWWEKASNHQIIVIVCSRTCVLYCTKRQVVSLSHLRVKCFKPLSISEVFVLYWVMEQNSLNPPKKSFNKQKWRETQYSHKQRGGLILSLHFFQNLCLTTSYY